MTQREPDEGGDPSRIRAALNLFARVLRIVGLGLLVVWMLPVTALSRLGEWNLGKAALVAGPLLFAAGQFLYSHTLRRFVVEHEE
jgi:hypothetical protein